MDRRQFFKTVAATVAGAVTVGVVPRVVAAKRPVVEKARQMGMSEPIKLWPIQQKMLHFGKPGNSKTIIVYDEFYSRVCGNPILGA